VPFESIGLQPFVVVAPEVAVFGVAAQHMKDADEDRVADADKGSFLATTTDQATELSREVRAFRMTGRPGRLHQSPS
jgi:hypothetical protein